MKILENYDLKKLNTFGVSCVADFFVELNSENDLQEFFISPIFQDPNIPKLFLGGGSNILFTKNFEGLVILNKLKGIEIIKEDLDFVWIKAQSGELWHDLVTFSVDRGYWGLENLSLIPGSVGAAPVQNIGAYGVELKDVLESVEVFEIKNNRNTVTKRIFLNQECEFSYRDSIFKKIKSQLKPTENKYFILNIILKLNKKENKNLNYKVLQDYINKNNYGLNATKPQLNATKNFIKSSKDISLVVSAIRKSKLPDPAIIGNAGSFFKNVILPQKGENLPPKLESLLKIYPQIPYFKESPSLTPQIVKIKIPAAWLIEKAGWKGYRKGNVGVHKDHALVLVNYGGATGAEIKNLSDQIIKSVFEKFDITLEPEVNIL